MICFWFLFSLRAIIFFVQNTKNRFKAFFFQFINQQSKLISTFFCCAPKIYAQFVLLYFGVERIKWSPHRISINSLKRVQKLICWPFFPLIFKCWWPQDSHLILEWEKLGRNLKIKDVARFKTTPDLNTFARKLYKYANDSARRSDPT